MRAVVQRVKWAKVSRVFCEKSEPLGEIGKGMLVFLGIGKGDNASDARYLADKLLNLRIFDDKNLKMNLSLEDVKGDALIVSEFTLYGDCRKGRRPDFAAAAPPEGANELYKAFIEMAGKSGLKVVTGEFRAYMSVELHNDGPVTFIIDSKK